MFKNWLMQFYYFDTSNLGAVQEVSLTKKANQYLRTLVIHTRVCVLLKLRNFDQFPANYVRAFPPGVEEDAECECSDGSGRTRRN